MSFKRPQHLPPVPDLRNRPGATEGTSQAQQEMVTGLDMADPENFKMVAAVFYKHFAPRCAKEDVCPDDTFSRVLESILKRNKGKSPYDPTRSAPTSWVWQVCRSVLSHQIDRQRRFEGTFDQGIEPDLAWAAEEAKY